MTSKEFTKLINELNEMTVHEIADVIMSEDMTRDQADQFHEAIPVELVSEVMSKME